MSPVRTTGQPWPWPQTMDAPLAAPGSHRLVLDNHRVRVLEVVIEPGAREPEHTHQAPSVMIVDEPARIRYYQGDAVLFESQARSRPRPACACAGWNRRGRIRSRTSTSAATTPSASNSNRPGPRPPPEAACVDRAGRREQKEQRNVIPP